MSLILIRLTFQDLKRMVVDTRQNWFMAGVAITLPYVLRLSLIHIILVLVLTFLQAFLFRLFESKADIGEADKETLNWLTLGYGFINPATLFFFSLFLVSITIITLLIKKHIFKISKPVPYYPVLLATFIGTNFLFILY